MQTSKHIYRTKRGWKSKSRSRAISNRKMVESSTMPIYKTFEEFDLIFIASVVFWQLFSGEHYIDPNRSLGRTLLCFAREVLTTRLATELSIFANNAMVSTTIRANNVTIRPTWLDDGLLALLVRGEVRCKGDNTVELLEIYHNTWSFFIKLYYKSLVVCKV